jgi:uncharacterized protein YjbJ (UPF0337 family)
VVVHIDGDDSTRSSGSTEKTEGQATPANPEYAPLIVDADKVRIAGTADYAGAAVCQVVSNISRSDVGGEVRRHLKPPLLESG